MPTARYVLKGEEPVDEGPIMDISVAKMQEFAIEKQIKALKSRNIATNISAIKLEKGRFKLRYLDTTIELYRNQRYTPYISKNGRLVIVVSGSEETEFTEEAMKKLKK